MNRNILIIVGLIIILFLWLHEYEKFLSEDTAKKTQNLISPSLTGEISGIDRDADGVRDDIVEFIFSEPLTHQQKSVLIEVAKTLQNYLLLDLSDEDAVRKSGEKSALSMVCLAHSFKKPIEATRYLKRLEALTMNTPQKAKKYLEYNKKRHGSFTRLPDSSLCNLRQD